MKFKGTKGKSEVSTINPKMALTENGAYKPNAMMLSTASADEMKANAKLIADAFNTVNECDMMPSELLAENTKLKKMQSDNVSESFRDLAVITYLTHRYKEAVEALEDARVDVVLRCNFLGLDPSEYSTLINLDQVITKSKEQ